VVWWSAVYFSPQRMGTLAAGATGSPAAARRIVRRRFASLKRQRDTAGDGDGE
jgi:hypothetical protein